MSDPLVEAFESTKKLQQKLQLNDALKRGQEPLWNEPLRGLQKASALNVLIKERQKESFNRNLPVSHLLNASDYDLQILRKALITLMYEIHDLEIDSNVEPTSIVNGLAEVLNDMIEPILKAEHGYFEKLSGSLGVSSVVLSIMGGALLQPSLMYIASHSDLTYLDAWDKTMCPICGRIPSVAVKSESEVWRFKCQYCLAEYRMDIFRCPRCGKEGTNNKEFLLVGEGKRFEIALCNECSYYYKIINKDRLDKPISEGLEDVYTTALDEVAHMKGFIRLDEIKSESS
jgi:formate dehydrogenase maturation protein FdhE